MVAYFLGGAVLSALTLSLYGADGWSGVCLLGALTAALALAVWAVTEAAARLRSDRRAAGCEVGTSGAD